MFLLCSRCKWWKKYTLQVLFKNLHQNNLMEKNLLLHPFFSFSGPPVQHSKEKRPQLFVHRRLFQLFCWETTVFPNQMRDIISTAQPESAPVSPLSWICLKIYTKETVRRRSGQLLNTSQLVWCRRVAALLWALPKWLSSLSWDSWHSQSYVVTNSSSL